MYKTTNLLFTGVGGQGTILTTKLLSGALAEAGYDVKMSEIHGMAQRGGTVNTQLKYGEKVYAPNIGEGEADYVVAFEKAEGLRALPYLKPGGTLITDDREIYSMPVLLGQQEYPHDWLNSGIEGIAIRVIPAYAIASEMGSSRDANIVLLGAIAKLLDIKINIPEKFNRAAYAAGEGAI
ncbi:MAG: indolepyruvate oxidoreductase subunit beta [Oscillospiraceae bacterium]|jgi:indolepyruvate ferredoxin oxidoreductase beta subunit|nr:indolepyruvate oxidoreductase subunit beta [Oscillospiraceae bacterium]